MDKTKPLPGLLMPPDFPSAAFDDLQLTVGRLDTKFRASHGGQPCQEWREFALACNGIKTRFRVVTDSEQTYLSTVPLSNDTYENVYMQDSALFSFFTNAVSVLEVLCYACFAIAAQLQPTSFPMKTSDDLRKISPHFVSDQFTFIYPSVCLTKALTALAADEEFKKLKDVRNTLSHRGNPSRSYNVTFDFTPGKPAQHLYLGGSKGEPPTWKGIRLDSAALSERRAWVVGHVDSLVSTALAFANDNVRT
jgi:hypothetical protein